MKTCPYCGEQFEPRQYQDRQVYCSPAHRKAASAVRLGGTCIDCGRATRYNGRRPTERCQDCANLSGESRMVMVHGTCGHRWTLNTKRTDASIESRPEPCRECREANGGRSGYVRVKVLGGNRRCVECGGALAALNPDETCGPCETTLRAKDAQGHANVWADHLAAERRAVLELLPATLPGLRIRLAGTRINALDAQRVIDGATKDGDVRVIGRLRGRPVWGLTRPLPALPEPDPLDLETRPTDEVILDALPGSATEVCGRVPFVALEYLRKRLRGLQDQGRVHRTGEGLRYDPHIWHAGPDPAEIAQAMEARS